MQAEYLFRLFYGLVVVVVTWYGTGILRRYAQRSGMLDIPNERSAHRIPTPRGGGLAIVVVLLASITLGVWSRQLLPDLFLALFVGGVAVAAIGWLDDRGHVNVLLRAAVHLSAGVWAVYCLAGLPLLDIGTQSIPLGRLGYVLAAFAVAWCINLYNFMDGIDGLAAGQAILTGVAGTVLVGWSAGPGLGLACSSVVLTAAGFLAWNFPPARIFMGDVASGLLGYWFAVLAFAGERYAQIPSLLWLILLAPFVADATFTLCWRILNREKWYAAHRTHAYQQLLSLGLDHRAILWRMVLLNILVCWPLAVLARNWPAGIPLLVALLYLKLWFVWAWIQGRVRSA